MKHCKLCGKGSIMAGTRRLLRGHYNPVNWSRKYPNLQKVKLAGLPRVAGKAGGQSVMACTRCRRMLVKPARR